MISPLALRPRLGRVETHHAMGDLAGWESGGGAVDEATLKADVVAWLESNNVFMVEEVLRENLVETVADLAFVGGTESQLGRLGFDAMTAVEIWDHLKPIAAALAGADDGASAAPAPAPAPKSIFARKKKAAAASEGSAEADLTADVGVWLAGVGASECEDAFRENMVETLGDVAFLVNSKANLTAMGLSSSQAGKLWDAIAALSAGSSEASAGAGSGGSGADMDEDVSMWLMEQGSSDCEDAMREAMVETVGDLMFLANSKGDLTKMGLSSSQAGQLWAAVKSAKPSPSPAASDDEEIAGYGGSAGGAPSFDTAANDAMMAMDAADWLAERGQGSAEHILRENMIETVADLAFLISSQSDMDKLGFAPVAQMDLWPDIEKLSATVDEAMAKEEGDPFDLDAMLKPKKSVFEETGSYSADIGGKNDLRLGWGKLAEGSTDLLPDDKPKKKKGGKKKTSGPSAAEKRAAKAEEDAERKAAAKAERKAAAKATLEGKKEKDDAKAEAAKEKAVEARKKKKAATEAKKAAAAEKKPKAAASSPKPKPSPKKKKKVAKTSSRLTEDKPIGENTPRSEAEMPPKPKRGKAKAPSSRLYAAKVEDEEAAGEFSPRLDWEVQKKLLEKLEAEQRRREEIEWRKEENARKEDEATKEREELKATYEWELNSTTKLDVSATGPVGRLKAGGPFKMSPGSARLVKNDDGLSFMERQERRAEQALLRKEDRKKQIAEEELAEVTAQPALSKASLKMTKHTVHESMSREERLDRLTSPTRVRQASPPSMRAVALATSALGSPPRRTKSKRGSPSASADRLSKSSLREQLRKQGAAQATELTFQPAINNSSRSMATKRRSPRHSPRNLGSPSRSGVASALSSIKTNIKSVWDQPGGVNVEKLFEHYDKDQDGWLSFSEWTRAIRRDGVAVGSGQHLSDEEHRQIFDYVDVDADGYISLAEFRQFLQPKSRRRTNSAGPSPTRGGRPSPRRAKIAPATAPAAIATQASGLGGPEAPASLPAASAELIEHCAEWVARHGQQFETILKKRNFGQPGASLPLFASRTARQLFGCRRIVKNLRLTAHVALRCSFAGWEFLFSPEGSSAAYYRQRLEHEMLQQISESAKRCVK